MELNEELVKYVEENIFPKYDKYYAHGMMHISAVIKNCQMLADYYNLDKNICFVIATFHDISLAKSRDKHEIESAKELINDKTLRKFFTKKELIMMKEAVEDHRGSKKDRPKSIYGECLSDSDRDFDITILARRQLATSIRNYKELVTFDEHFERCYNYMCTKINKDNHFNLWTNNPLLVEKREVFEKEYMNKENARQVYKNTWDNIITTGTYDKIVNYYQDF